MILDDVLKDGAYDQTLRQSPPQDVAGFLGLVAGADTADGEKERDDYLTIACTLLTAVLKDGAYDQKLRNGNLNQLGQFLKQLASLHGIEAAQQRLDEYWGTHPEEKLQRTTKELPSDLRKLFVHNLWHDGLQLPVPYLQTLLGVSSYLVSVRSTEPPHNMKTIWNYFEPHIHEPDGLANRVMSSGDELDMLRGDPVQFGLILLGQLMEAGQKEIHNQLVANLLALTEFRQVVIQAPLDIQAEFYRHLSYYYGRPEAQNFLDVCWAEVEPDAFRNRLKDNPPALVGRFRQALIETKLDLPVELWTVLTNYAN